MSVDFRCAAVWLTGLAFCLGFWFGCFELIRWGLAA